MEEKKKNHLMRDLLLVAVILIVAAAGFSINYFRQKEPESIAEGTAAETLASNKIVEVSIDGTVIETLNLNEDTENTIHGYNNGTNHLVIRDGQVWIDDASCPDKVCIHQGKISRNSEMIVCLPNLMIAQVRIVTE